MLHSRERRTVPLSQPHRRRDACAVAGAVVLVSLSSVLLANDETSFRELQYAEQSLSRALLNEGFWFLLSTVLESLLFLAGGLLAGGLSGFVLMRRSRSGFRTVLAGLAAILFGYATHQLLAGQAPAFADAVPWVIGSVFGAALLHAARAAEFRTKRLRQIAILLLLAELAASASIFYAATDSAAAEFDVPEPTSAEKRKLIERLRSTQLLSRDSTKPREIRLTELEVNMLVDWKWNLDRVDIRSRILFSGSRFLLQATKPWRVLGLWNRHCNVLATGRVSVRNGRIELLIDELLLGRMLLSAGARSRLAQAIVSALEESSESEPLLGVIESMRIDDATVEIVAVSGGVRNDWLEAMLSRRPISPDVKIAAVEQVEHLIEWARAVPVRPTFEGLLSAAFEKAHDQSERLDHRDANKSALLALGIVVSDPQLARLIDFDMQGTMETVVLRRIRRLRLRNRFDLAQHFCASAALTVAAGNDISDLLGRVKEEIDAGIPGKGFSFVDMLADRAGTRFARVCISDATRARELQEQLRRGVDIDLLFPSVEGLPERINESELSSEFGGVGGEQYQHWIREIEQRLDRTLLLNAAGTSQTHSSRTESR